MSVLLILVLGVAALVCAAALDLFLLHRGLRCVGPDGEIFWIRPRSFWNVVLGGHEGVSIRRTCHFRLTFPGEKVVARFVAHEWRHLYQQADKVPTLPAPTCDLAWLWKYETDGAFRQDVEDDATAYGLAQNASPFWMGIVAQVNAALGV